jgi:hypothetical protein
LPRWGGGGGGGVIGRYLEFLKESKTFLFPPEVEEAEPLHSPFLSELNNFGSDNIKNYLQEKLVSLRFIAVRVLDSYTRQNAKKCEKENRERNVQD